jgi:hypothetical protein
VLKEYGCSDGNYHSTLELDSINIFRTTKSPQF